MRRDLGLPELRAVAEVVNIQFHMTAGQLTNWKHYRLLRRVTAQSTQVYGHI